MAAPCKVTFSWEPRNIDVGGRDPRHGPIYSRGRSPQKRSRPSPCVRLPYCVSIYPRGGLLVCAAFIILSYHAAPLHAQVPMSEQPPHPCPCLRPDVALPVVAASQELAELGPANHSSLENSAAEGNLMLGNILPPELFQDGSICKDVLQSFPHSWNTSAEQGEGAGTSAPSSKAVAMALNSGCHRTCAIVANGYRLLGSGHGPEIDQADVIIRMNEAPVRGYENDVGNRTTIRFVHPKALMAWVGIQLKAGTNRDWEPDLFLMRCNDWCFNMFKYKHDGVPVPRTVLLRNHIRSDYPPDVADKLVVASENLFRITGLFAHNRATTGSMAVALGMLLCEKVWMYGFGQAGEIYYGHYFTTKKKKYTVARPNVNNLGAAGGFKHNFAGEWQSWKLLHEAGFVINVP